ncbi:Motility protein A [Candidatus Sulfopaludibacter sp. SbA3]|nr:Motility protein A [Candidatus Sulfopaludibacter sp. SbA3]
MFVIIGCLVVIGAILGGFVMEQGQLLVLFQPAELLIIAGAALGTILISNPIPTLKRMGRGILGTLKGDSRGTAFYLENLKMLNELFQYARKNGIAKLEVDIDEPEKSPVFAKYPAFLQNHHAVYFICDTLRMFISGGVDPFELDQMMELDMEVHHHELHEPVASLSTVADSLPGLGIVAAVLGVVITMGALGGPPEEIGHKVAAALVGTFLGILLCYGFLGPVASRMARANDADARFYHVMRVGVLAFMRGSAPILAVEFARRAIPSSIRPTFQELEKTCRGGSAPAAAAAAA